MNFNKGYIWQPAFKRFLKDQGLYMGKVRSDGWNLEATRAWQAFCDRSNAVYTESPTYENQPADIKVLMEEIMAAEMRRREKRGDIDPADELPAKKFNPFLLLPDVPEEPEDGASDDLVLAHKIAKAERKKLERVLRPQDDTEKRNEKLPARGKLRTRG